MLNTLVLYRCSELSKDITIAGVMSDFTRTKELRLSEGALYHSII